MCIDLGELLSKHPLCSIAILFMLSSISFFIMAIYCLIKGEIPSDPQNQNPFRLYTVTKKGNPSSFYEDIKSFVIMGLIVFIIGVLIFCICLFF